MKHGKRCRVRHRRFLNSLGMEWRTYLVERETYDEYRFIDKTTGKILSYSRLIYEG